MRGYTASDLTTYNSQYGLSGLAATTVSVDGANYDSSPGQGQGEVELDLNAASGYTQHSYNVSSLAGQTVTLTVTGTEDSSQRTSFVLDDTALTVS